MMDPQIISRKAYAKINLCLNILGRLPSGYHEICTVMQRISLHDNIKLKISAGAGIGITCTDKALANEHNIACKAADLFFRTAGVSADIIIDIEKNIPAQAGLGGGSSDGAAVLLALNGYFDSMLAERELIELAARIGADLPFFVKDISCAACRGIGEKITPHRRELTGCVLIAKPDYNISTRQAFADWDKRTACAVPGRFKNDFSALAFEQNKGLHDICELMLKHGASQAELTGSGSALFGIFASREKARECGRVLDGRGDIKFCGVYDFV